ncbi:hypothetical protein CPB83DRAFT_893355 [Crepidotus variabilis]|uniref:Uncharacterized protein n=1 Tax=Crepidotus variabilis TaxID=179855 RepID=A0A9P6EIM5_9AGAR|nr:hypothetical protein CPB83DRAFT_893355 [Crepidotus variabilis]
MTAPTQDLTIAIVPKAHVREDRAHVSCNVEGKEPDSDIQNSDIESQTESFNELNRRPIMNERSCATSCCIAILATILWIVLWWFYVIHKAHHRG